MVELSKGGNAVVSAPRVRAVLAWDAAPGSPDLDVTALLLRGDGRVASDDDMVFYNQPSHPGGAVRHAGKQPQGPRVQDVVEVDLTSLARATPEVERVVLVASVDGGTFARVRGLSLQLADAGAELVRFDVPAATTETAMVVGELYRRAGDWRLRAVGQGYDDGLAGLARDFGVSVDDDPPAQAAAPAAATATSAAGAAATRAGAATPARPTVNLDKGRVDLRKGERVSLVKTGAPPLRSVVMGLGWDPARAGSSIDLDASALAYDRRGEHLGSVWFLQLHAFDRSVVHAGDNLTGEGEGDDEQIRVDLAALPATVHSIVFAITSFGGHPFTEVRGAFCRLVDAAAGTELVRYDLSGSEPRTAVLMAALSRDGAGAWVMTALGQFLDGKNARYLVEPGRKIATTLGG
ncbi:TerD family protein [Angustibacter aerolatus]